MFDEGSSVPIVGLIDYHSGDVTKRCVDSIRSTSSGPVQFVVVDNGGSVDWSASDVEVVLPGTNLGFAGGCNLLLDIAKNAGAPWLWLINNDCVVLPGWPGAIDSAVGSGAADVYTTVVLLGDSQTVWYAGGEYDERTNRHRHVGYGVPVTELRLPEMSHTHWASGANIVVPFSTLAECVPFDEHLFLYREEFDWQRSNSFVVGIIGRPLVRHYPGSSTRAVGANLETFFSARNSWITGNRYLSRPQRPRFWLAWTIDFVVKPVARRQWGKARAGVAGLRARRLSGPEAILRYRTLVRRQSMR